MKTLKSKTLQHEIPENELLVDLTLHDFPVSLLRDFAVEVAKPNYSGNLTAALQDLMQKALGDQEFVARHIKATS